MSGLNSREQSLVALGAVIASNCVPCVEYHIPGAKRAGLSDIEICDLLPIDMAGFGNLYQTAA